MVASDAGLNELGYQVNGSSQLKISTFDIMSENCFILLHPFVVNPFNFNYPKHQGKRSNEAISSLTTSSASFSQVFLIRE